MPGKVLRALGVLNLSLLCLTRAELDNSNPFIGLYLFVLALSGTTGWQQDGNSKSRDLEFPPPLLASLGIEAFGNGRSSPVLWVTQPLYFQVFLKIDEEDVEHALKDGPLVGSIFAGGL